VGVRSLHGIVERGKAGERSFAFSAVERDPKLVVGPALLELPPSVDRGTTVLSLDDEWECDRELGSVRFSGPITGKMWEPSTNRG